LRARASCLSGDLQAILIHTPFIARTEFRLPWRFNAFAQILFSTEQARIHLLACNSPVPAIERDTKR
jgi:hypothetical protein